MGSTRTWITIIGITVVGMVLLFLTGNLVIQTKPAEDDSGDGEAKKIVKIVEEEPEALERSAE